MRAMKILSAFLWNSKSDRTPEQNESKQKKDQSRGMHKLGEVFIDYSEEE